MRCLITGFNGVFRKTVLMTLIILIALPLMTSFLDVMSHSVTAHDAYSVLKDPYSGAHVLDTLNPTPNHKPIYIVGDANFTEENGVIAGNGTKENPYIIANWVIPANMSITLDGQQFNTGIYIANTTKYFIVRNVTVFGGDFGILLINVTNFEVSNTTISHCSYGIYVEGEDGVIENNYVHNIEKVTDLNVICGIYSIANNTIIRGNKIENVNGPRDSYTDGIVIYAPDYLVYNVTVEDNVVKNIYNPLFGEGIWVGTYGNGVLRNVRVISNVVENVTDNSILVSNKWGGTSNDVTIANNIIHNATNRGILLYHINGNVDLVNNSVSHVSDIAGIGVEHSTGKFTIQDNTISNITNNGIHILNTSNVEILGNLVDPNNTDSGTGVKIEHSNSITIRNNSISNMGWNGIETSNSSLITIENNHIVNIEREGVYLANTTEVIIKNNSFSNMPEAIDLNNCSQVSVVGNEASETQDFILAYGGNNYLIANNTGHGFKVMYGDWGFGIAALTNDTTVEGNSIYDANALGKDFDAIWVGAVGYGTTAHNITVRNNHISNLYNASWAGGIVFWVDSYSSASNVVIVDNYIRNLTSKGVLIDALRPGARISNVTVKNNIVNCSRNDEGIVAFKAMDIYFINNTVINSRGGIHFYNVTSGLIASNIVENTTEWPGVKVDSNSSNIMIESNRVYHINNDGFAIVTSTNVSVNSSTLDEIVWSGIAIYESSDVYVVGSTIRDSGHSGVFIHNSSEVLVEGNSIENVSWACIDLTHNTNNSGITVVKNNLSVAGSGVWIGFGNSRIEVHFNNIVDVSEWGVYNDPNNDVVNASLNWWGDLSGPGGEGLGSGAPVSGNVIYKPWLNAPYPSGKAISGDGAKASATLSSSEMMIVNATQEADAQVFANGSGTVEVSVIKYSINPVDTAPPKVFKFIDVHISNPSAPSAIKVRIYYRADELESLPETEITPYWWDGDKWIMCSSYLVNTTDQNGYSGYVEITITSGTTPSLTDLAGTPISLGSSPPPVVGGTLDIGSPLQSEGAIALMMTTITTLVVSGAVISAKKRHSQLE